MLKVMDWIGMLWLWTIRRMCNCVCMCVPFASSLPSICDNDHVFLPACCVLSCLACECAVAVCLACCLQNTPLCASVHECAQTSTLSRVSTRKPNQAIINKRTREKVPPFADTTRKQASKRAKEDSEKNKRSRRETAKAWKKVSCRQQDSRNFSPRTE